MAFDPDKLTGLFVAVEGVIKFADSLRQIDIPNVPVQSYGDMNERVNALEEFSLDVGVYLNRIRDLEVPTLDITAAELTEAMYSLDGELNRTRPGNITVDGAVDVQVDDAGVKIVMPTAEPPDDYLNADEKVRVSSDDTRAAGLRSTAAELAETPSIAHKVIGDSEADAASATTGYWIQATIINAGADEQLKIEHVGPGPTCCWERGTSDCSGHAWDALGHITGHWDSNTGVWVPFRAGEAEPGT